MLHARQTGTFNAPSNNAILPLLMVLAGLASGCVRRAENEVVLYSAADREFAAPIVGAFERRHEGTTVAAQYDIEASKTVGLVTRIESEKDSPRCDLFWNNEILHTLRLDREGLLAKTSWDIPRNWPQHMRSKNGTWVAFGARARILIVNRELLADRSQWPRSVMELADPKWKSKCAVALPLFGTTATHFTVLRNKLGAKKADEWFQSVSQNAVVLAGNKQVAQAVSSGQCTWGITDTDDYLVEQDNGLPVEVVFPDQEASQLGTLLIPNTVCIIKGARHPVAAQKLGDFLLSEDIEGRLAMGPSGQIPIRPNHPQKSRAAPTEPVRFMDADFEAATNEWPETTERLRTLFHSAPQ